MTMSQDEATLLFRSLISLCGLTQAEAAELLDYRHDTVRSKAIGRREVTTRDLGILRGLWLRIDAGDADLTGRPAEQAAAIRWARSVSTTDTGDDA